MIHVPTNNIRKIFLSGIDGFYQSNIFLCIVIFIFSGLSFSWLFQDTLPPAWDQSHHALLSLKYYRALTETAFPFSLKCLFKVSHSYPPFFHLSALSIVALAGFSVHKLILVNFFYIVLLVFSISGIGKILFNKRVGAFSAALTLFYPMMFALSHEFLIDFALVSMVSGVQYLILRSRGGFEPKWNVALGMLAGCALLTKQTAAYSIFPLWGFVFLNEFKNRNMPAFFCSVAITMVIAAPWYIVSFPDMLNQWAVALPFGAMSEWNPSSFMPACSRYFDALRFTLISSGLLLFFWAGLCLFLLFDRRRYVFTTLIVWTLPAFLALVFTPYKDPRYIMPILPVFALLTMVGIDALRGPLRKILSLLVLLFAFTQIVCLYFGCSFSLFNKQGFFYCFPPSHQDWKNEEVVLTLHRYFGDKRLRVGVLSDHVRFNNNQLIFYNDLLRFPYGMVALGDSPVSIEQVKKYDIFIMKDHFIGLDGCHSDRCVGYREKCLKELEAVGMQNLGFVKLVDFQLPDKSKLTVLRKANVG